MADVKVTQLSVLALADHVSCVTKWAQCWTITRTDGQVFAYTSLDTDLTFRGVLHKACDSLSATATEMSAALGSVGNMELVGILSDTGIKDEELYVGLFDGAEIEVWMVPWENAGGEVPFRLLAGTMGDIRQGLQGFNAEIITPGATMQQKPLLEVVTPSCRYELGDSRCTVDLDALTVSGSVTSLTIPTSPNSTARRVFVDSTRTEADGFFNLGEVEWLTGDNAGVISEVKDFTSKIFTLWDALLHPIQVGDTFDARPGCNKVEGTCKDAFDNFDNFGGFNFVPGEDRLSQTPDAK